MNTESDKTTSEQNKQILSKYYLLLAVIFVVLGILFFCILTWFPQVFATCFFFSLAAATIIYGFLGGINKEDSFKTKTLNIGGASATFLALFIILNYTLEAQVKELAINWDITPQNYQKLLVINTDKDSSSQELVVGITNRKLQKIIIKPPVDLVEKFVGICWEQKGVCTQQFKPVDLVVDKSLSHGEGRVCDGAMKYAGLPITVLKGKTSTISIYVSWNPLGPCARSMSEHLILGISNIDFQTLNNCSAREKASSRDVLYALGPFRKPSKEPAPRESCPEH